MKPKRNKSFVWLLTIAFIITQLIFVSPLLAQPTTNSANTGTDRICGDDRYQTAAAVSQKGWETAEYAVLARGDNFADALCAGPLAQKYGGPILLTSPTKLSSDTLSELKRLGVKHLFIAGGLGAVSQSVENTLKSAGIETIERIHGQDRYQTSVKIAEKFGLNNKIILATGSDFPDALSISAIAAKLQIPILLTAKDKLPASVNNYLQTKAVTQTYIVGGTGVIAPSVEKSLLGVTRLAGSNRYETNKVIIQKFEKDLNFENIYVATGGGKKGNEFADALTGAVLAAKNSSPLVLSSQTLPAGTADYLKTKILLSSKVTGLGGKAVVPSSVFTGIIAYKEQIPVAEKYSAAGTYGPETGSETIKGDVTISTADVTLRNVIIEGDLLLAQSISNGNVTLKDVTVKGKTIINGGGPNSIIMYNFNGETVIIDVPDGSSVRLLAQGSTSINNVSVEGNGILEESQLTGAGFINVEIPAGAQVTLSGDFEEVSVEAGGANINVNSGSINTMTIAGTAAGSTVNLGTGASVGTLDINAQSSITGQGQITNANINSANVTIQQTPATTTIADGLTANVGGHQQSGTNTAPTATGGGGGGGGSSVSVTGVTLDKTAITISTGASETLVATVAPDNATNKKVTWASNAESVATVNNGVVTGVAPGTAEITATTADGNKAASCAVRVLSVYDTTATLGTWVKDRTEPQTWSITDDIITLETKTEPNNNWYAWQGRKASTDMDPTSVWKAETEIELTEELLGRDGVRTSMWLNVADAKGTNIDWAILQFKIEEDSGTKGWQYWNSEDPGTWVDIDGLPTSEGKYQLAIHYSNGKIIQFINGKEVNSYDIGETEISYVKEVIFNSYSFGESYTALWKLPTVKYYKEWPFSAGSGGTLPAFPIFSAGDNKIGGLYITDNHKPLIMYYAATPIFRNQISMKFIPPGDMGASSYTLQISSDGTTWSNYQLEGSDVTTSSVDQDNFCIENPGGDYHYRLLVNGGPKDGYTSNHAEAQLTELKSAFSGYSLDESMMLTGVIAPYVGRGLLASFSAVKYIVDGKDVYQENFTDENMTFQWYRVNPETYEMIAISGATELAYTTTEADAGYLLLIRAAGDETNIEGYSQVFSQSDTVIPNKAYISNVTDSGFTLNLYKNVDSLSVSELDLYDTLGNPVTIDSVTQGANKAIYNITADISSASEPYYLYNNSPFWRIVSEEDEHMMMQGVVIAFPI